MHTNQQSFIDGVLTLQGMNKNKNIPLKSRQAWIIIIVVMQYEHGQNRG